MLNAQQIGHFGRIYDANFSQIYNYVYARVMAKETAEDLTSDVFLRALEHFESFDSRKASVRTWLFTIARNRVTDHFRIAGRTVALDEVAEPSEDFEEQFDKLSDETNREVYRLLSKLNEQEREIISLRFFSGLKLEDIADLLEVSTAAVSKRITRILGKMKNGEN